MTGYNYEEFTSNSYNLDRFYGPEVGSKAPDFTLVSTSQQEENLLNFTGDFLVIELGSITCPLFQGRREGMSDLVSQFPQASFSVLYVREAHPGTKLPAHKTFDDKIGYANTLKKEDGEQRKILVDDIDGTAHKAYGDYPNAVFIINKKGCVVFRSDWNSVPATKAALKKLLAGQPAHSKSYFLPVKPTVALRTLRRSGNRAVLDFLKGLPKLIWKNIIRRNFLLFLGKEKSVAPDASC